MDKEILIDGSPVEITEEPSTERVKIKTAKLSDVITIQCILCLLVIIALVTLNIVNSELSSEVCTKYSEQSENTSFADDAAKKLAELTGITQN